ncbi:hypothetical protein [Streptomyces sp. NPDC057616]|uniref:hypothetical protein n=1 Tax=Streptomyces sp. NPDC057616 TaxID=3346183 RepID=UPI0036967481
MHVTGLLVALLMCAVGLTLGARSLLAPRQATLDYGVAADNLRAPTAIKAVRDITSGVVLLVVWIADGRTASAGH